MWITKRFILLQSLHINPVITALSVLPISAALLDGCSHSTRHVLTCFLCRSTVVDSATSHDCIYSEKECRTCTLFYLEISWSLFIADSAERQRAPSDASFSAVRCSSGPWPVLSPFSLHLLLSWCWYLLHSCYQTPIKGWAEHLRKWSNDQPAKSFVSKFWTVISNLISLFMY